MVDMVYIDFETRSRCDLKTAGSYTYAKDFSTDILCMSVMSDVSGDDIWTWVPADGALDAETLEIIATADFIVAHNAQFDRLIWDYIAVEEYGFPEISLEKWYCSSAQARVNALPANLDDATRAISSRHRKNPRGSALIKALSIPQADGAFNNDPALLEEMYIYCEDDVAAMKELVQCTRKMTPTEHADWVANERINDRGVRINATIAELSQEYAGAEQDALATELVALTGGAVTKHTQHKRIKEWVMSRTTEDVHQVMKKYVGGVVKYSADKNVRAELLSLADLFHKGEAVAGIDLPDDVYDVLMCSDEGNKSSVSKFKRMLERADIETGRVSGAFVFAGAAQTQRYASRGLQLHNMRRDCWSPEEARELQRRMVAREEIPDVMNTLSKLLRPSLIPDEGNIFVVGDWSQIEARALPWLSDSQGGREKLAIFAANDADPKNTLGVYEAAAVAMGLDAKKDRQIGKVSELALGYGGAAGAFGAMARIYGLALPEHQVEDIVRRWREANRWAVKFWHQLAKAAINAVSAPGTTFSAGMVSYTFVKDLIGGTLLCSLPGGYFIQYPKARVEAGETPWGAPIQKLTALKASFNPSPNDKEWPRQDLWYGLLAENIAQAFTAAIARRAIGQAQDYVVAHVHDEIVLEVPETEAEERSKWLQQIMEAEVPWAEGLPLKAAPEIMTAYGK